jgi:predicted porin
VIEKDHILKPNTNYLDYNVDTTVSYKKNKLSDVYFQVPLLFQFDTPKVKKNNTFHLLFGVVGGIKVGAWTKQKYDNNDSKNFRTTRDDFNLAPFRWSAMVKLGYGPVNVFASYQLNQMFKPDHGPQLYPFTVGITLLGF